jgi:hypothetical protein
VLGQDICTFVHYLFLARIRSRGLQSVACSPRGHTSKVTGFWVTAGPANCVQKGALPPAYDIVSFSFPLFLSLLLSLSLSLYRLSSLSLSFVDGRWKVVRSQRASLSMALASNDTQVGGTSVGAAGARQGQLGCAGWAASAAAAGTSSAN